MIPDVNLGSTDAMSSQELLPQINEEIIMDINKDGQEEYSNTNVTKKGGPDFPPKKNYNGRNNNIN